MDDTEISHETELGGELIPKTEREPTLEDCETAIDRYAVSRKEAALALFRIHEGELWRAPIGESIRYHDFDDYCAKRWGFSRQRVYQLVGHGHCLTRRELSTMVDTMPIPFNERHARALLSGIRARRNQDPNSPELWQRRAEALQIAIDEARSNRRPLTGEFLAGVIDEKYRGIKTKPKGAKKGSKQSQPPPTDEHKRNARQVADSVRRGQEGKDWLKTLKLNCEGITEGGVSALEARERHGDLMRFEWFAKAVHWIEEAAGM